MMDSLEPERVEAGATEAEGPFYVARGALSFTHETDLSPNIYSASHSVLAVSGRHGLTFFTDPAGTCSASLTSVSHHAMHLARTLHTK